MTSLRAYLVDDEPLALKRLARLLQATGRVEIAGSSTDPEAAVGFLSENRVDLLFLDIQMPGLSGFDVLARLSEQPLVIFTTAFDQYALKAFEVNSIDFLLKPVEPQQLDRALNKIERLRATAAAGGGAEDAARQEWLTRPDVRAVLAELAEKLRAPESQFPDRVASRLGDRVQFVELARVTHFFAKDKLTYAATSAGEFPVDATISELEKRLDPARWVRIHRSTLLNLTFVREVHTWFGGQVLVRLSDAGQSELPVARDRVRILKQRLHF